MLQFNQTEHLEVCLVPDKWAGNFFYDYNDKIANKRLFCEVISLPTGVQILKGLHTLSARWRD
jgi:hypothetical protein